MTRNPIIVTITTIFAVGLLVGLAYGASRNSGPRNGGGHATAAATRVVARGGQVHGVGPLTRTQARSWIDGWMRDHCCGGFGPGWHHRYPVRHGDRMIRPGYVPASGPSAPSQAGPTGSGSGPVSRDGSGDRYRRAHHAYRGSHHDGGWHHHCW